MSARFWIAAGLLLTCGGCPGCKLKPAAVEEPGAAPASVEYGGYVLAIEEGETAHDAIIRHREQTIGEPPAEYFDTAGWPEWARPPLVWLQVRGDQQVSIVVSEACLTLRDGGAVIEADGERRDYAGTAVITRHVAGDDGRYPCDKLGHWHQWPEIEEVWYFRRACPHCGRQESVHRRFPD